MIDGFAVLAEPTRRRILDQLRLAPVTVGGLVDALELPQPTVSKHLRVLRDAGLVTASVDAQRRVYQLDPGGLSEVEQWLAPYRALWNRHLDALEAHLAGASGAGRDRRNADPSNTDQCNAVSRNTDQRNTDPHHSDTSGGQR